MSKKTVPAKPADTNVKLRGLGQRLRLARLTTGLSQRTIGLKIAELVGRGRPYSAAAVGKWELGESDPDLDALLALAHVMQTEIGWLLTGTGPQSMGRDERTKGRFVRKITVRQALAEPIDYASDECCHTHFPCSDAAFALVVWNGRNDPELREGLDQVIVDPDVQARPGDTVFANVEGEATLGQFVRTADGGQAIEAANRQWHTVIIRPERGDRFVGPVTEQARRRRTGF